ncbi:hypothetical protein E2C01_023986 [Portunus trituberculatus]|uniref:Uncharacterized protein n=1 Tax=Portunus trituberculatus TaxID=210409 RepID=A0A5B7EBZ8_PORTR|nr:hypothetical protein [Portunus trituberculatus]
MDCCINSPGRSGQVCSGGRGKEMAREEKEAEGPQFRFPLINLPSRFLFTPPAGHSSFSLVPAGPGLVRGARSLVGVSVSLWSSRICQSQGHRVYTTQRAMLAGQLIPYSRFVSFCLVSASSAPPPGHCAPGIKLFAC